MPHVVTASIWLVTAAVAGRYDRRSPLTIRYENETRRQVASSASLMSFRAAYRVGCQQSARRHPCGDKILRSGLASLASECTRRDELEDYLNIDSQSFVQAFAHRSILIRHYLADHPLFAMDAMGALADELPAKSVGREPADAPAFAGARPADLGGGPPSETIQDIHNNRCRVILRDIQQAPRYRELINACLDQVADIVADREGGMGMRAGYLFISPTEAVTPMHFDAEHSFLLQIRGTKHVSFSPLEDSDVRQHELDRYYDQKPLSDAIITEATSLTMGPGEGVYIPAFVPHWVETEAGLSVSFSIPFYTALNERVERVNLFNKQLRRLHVSPRPPSRSERVDYAKSVAYGSWAKLRAVREATRR